MTTVAFIHSLPRWHHHRSHLSSRRKSNKHTARENLICFSAAAATDVNSPSSSLEAKALKADLLSVVAGLDRGIFASDDDVEAADLASKRLEDAGDKIELPRDLDKLQGKWRLVYSSAFASGNLGGSRPGPRAARFPLTLGPVYQRIDVLSREFDNIVEFRAPTPWPLPPLETRATLAHTFELPGGASVKIIFDKTSIKGLGVLSELPPLDLPRLPDFLRSSSSGLFTVSYLDDDFRITRGDRGELRVFVKL
ncbi:plastid-lipid-associated protein 6, chloroplastic [Selaginella moellendorffii]|nr:plastid-lipid-associated protein 6, chloroplastic [Selaginella moellendorffii]XP_024538074.1 plastid-lipid-associated protein 6, chloroplastic [Selaginella moellendorffii]|eukprot:XP_002977538.2 plastid-lipid-associated protein 6, chloroplastic [Selaginella moellendorffii]